ncbi:MAG: hypothetical protein WKF37_23630 [Bryobacteraceae bacterium]
MSITAGLAATKAALDVTKIVMDKLNRPEVNVHDIRAQIQEMLIHVVNAQIALSDAQSAVHSADETNRQLRAEITALKDAQAVRQDLIFGDEVYLRKETNGKLDGPFCPACWDIDGKLVRLKLDYIGNYAGAAQGSLCRKYDCIVHKISYFMSAAKFNDVNVA